MEPTEEVSFLRQKVQELQEENERVKKANQLFFETNSQHKKRLILVGEIIQKHGCSDSKNCGLCFLKDQLEKNDSIKIPIQDKNGKWLVKED